MIINLGNQYGGIERHIESFLKIIDLKNIKLYLVCRKDSKFHKSLINGHISSEIKILAIDIGRKRIIKSIRNLSKYIKKENINIIHSHGITSNLICNIVKSKGIKSINSVHGYSDFDRMDKSFLARKIFDLLERKLIMYNDVLIAVSSDIKKYLVNKGANKDKIIILNHGISIDKDLKLKKASKKNNFINIGSLGRLEKVKGYDILIKAINYCVKSGYKNINCRIAGVGSEEKKLQKLIDTFQINDYCKLIGFINETNEFLEDLDIYIQPSIIESFGISIIEAMNNEIAIIATDSGGVRDIIKNDNGILVKPYDYIDIANNIIYLISNYKVRKEIAINGKKTAYYNFSINDKVIEYENILYYLMDSKNGG